jgi:hypothetical protein
LVFTWHIRSPRSRGVFHFTCQFILLKGLGHQLRSDVGPLWYMVEKEIWTCNATHPWMVMNIYAKYHNLDPNGSQIIEWTHLVTSRYWS